MHKISILKVNSPYSGRQCMNIIIESCILHSVCTKQSQIDLVQFVRVLKSAWLLICLFTCDRRVTRHQLRRYAHTSERSVHASNERFSPGIGCSSAPLYVDWMREHKVISTTLYSSLHVHVMTSQTAVFISIASSPCFPSRVGRNGSLASNV
jgi:hypothetical protein